MKDQPEQLALASPQGASPLALIERTWPTKAEQEEIERVQAIQQRTHTTPHEI